MTDTLSVLPRECRLEETRRITPSNETAVPEEAAALSEARRCLGNHFCQSCDLCRLVCPELCITRNASGRIEIDLEYCKGCGICAFICPKKAICMEREE